MRGRNNVFPHYINRLQYRNTSKAPSLWPYPTELHEWVFYSGGGGGDCGPINQAGGSRFAHALALVGVIV